MYHRAIEDREVTRIIQEEMDSSHDNSHEYDYEYGYDPDLSEYDLDYSDPYYDQLDQEYDPYGDYDDLDYTDDDFGWWEWDDKYIFSPGKYYNILGTDKNVFCVKYRDNDLFFDTKTGLEYTGPRYKLRLM